MDLPKRKTTRLPDYDYSSPGYYFITVCTKGKQKLLCDIVGTGLPDGPHGIIYIPTFVFGTLSMGKVLRKCGLPRA